MTRLAKLQFIGPAVLLVAIAGAEGAGYTLAYSPSSQILWYVNSVGFGLFRRGEDVLNAQFDIAHVQLCFIGMPLFLIASCGLFLKRVLLLAIASNLCFLYSSCLLYACYGHEPRQMASLTNIHIEPGAFMPLALFVCALSSFAISHIIYICDICNECG